ncbi:hypothetical protein MAR_016518 [Mya arenaria]|uniref:Uncharacterized protein n=1 Tax=Mya arenaria TaxID=6604 RepID=A0ABY7FMI2_MYAAR|nr:hypothetical protein MAR_016518 [Mya arenaria]
MKPESVKRKDCHFRHGALIPLEQIARGTGTVSQRWTDVTEVTTRTLLDSVSGSALTSRTVGLSSPPLGQRWVDATRACLQKSLVPALKPLKPMTCKEVQTFAFHTHGQCYTRAAAGVPTFCNLGWADWLRISWIVKQALWREAGETVNQAVHILGQCSTGLFG